MVLVEPVVTMDVATAVAPPKASVSPFALSAVTRIQYVPAVNNPPVVAVVRPPTGGGDHNRCPELMSQNSSSCIRAGISLAERLRAHPPATFCRRSHSRTIPRHGMQ